MKLIKKNMVFLIGIFIPILILLLVTISLYLPPLLNHPRYDFIYQCGNYYGIHSHIFTTANDQIVEEDLHYKSPFNSPNPAYHPMLNLYLYTVTDNQSHEIALDDAKKFHLNPNTVSADGFSLTSGQNDNPFFIIPADIAAPYYHVYYLSGHGISRRLKQFPDMTDCSFVG